MKRLLVHGDKGTETIKYGGPKEPTTLHNLKDKSVKSAKSI
ncbi:hypothetical protein PL9631_120046 [Planktothrix paucivesiculata PCC 9631]|uniref:Uncharacterized protein n=1 Tax=Planktothrix paucivesiculata PCC 9631 TaxID=671071 RepID=A0A7Z9BMX1_9CYAN|nr:hypothetical protein PL9631_120046 [Planktothrix paucivesiculata PCC 9631]